MKFNKEIKIYENLIQGSDEWKKIKAGVFSASNVSDLCGAKGPGKTGESLIIEKFGEYCTGELDEISSKAMQHGTDTEPIARGIYENMIGLPIYEYGFITNEKYPNCGVSLDGVVFHPFENNFLIEIKCPFTQKSHSKFAQLLNPNVKDKGALLKVLEPKYFYQIQMGLLISELSEARFISFHKKFLNEEKGIDLRIIDVVIYPDFDAQNLISERLNEANLKLEFLKKQIIRGYEKNSNVYN